MINNDIIEIYRHFSTSPTTVPKPAHPAKYRARKLALYNHPAATLASSLALRGRSAVARPRRGLLASLVARLAPFPLRSLGLGLIARKLACPPFAFLWSLTLPCTALSSALIALSLFLPACREKAIGARRI